MQKPRYAIYAVPVADSALYRFGAAVLGYDVYTGQDVPFAAAHNTAAWRNVVLEPRRYGFHGTLKAPFYLANGRDEAELTRQFADFAANLAPVAVGRLVVCDIGSFIAITPDALSRRLDALAQSCVREFDRFRAPLADQERKRRLVKGLTSRQIEHLENWGYPYVFEDFRFHMTLSGSLRPELRNEVLTRLRSEFARDCGATPVTIDSIALMKQPDSKSPFRVMASATLGFSAVRPFAAMC